MKNKFSWASLFLESLMRKTERFAFKLTPEDKRALRRLADVEGVQAAVIVRRLIRQAIAHLDTDFGGGNVAQPTARTTSSGGLL
jgi:hypothetical protein